MTIPPAYTFCTNSFFICSLLVKRYAARGFDFEFMTSKLSSKFSTYQNQNRMEYKLEENRRNISREY